MSVILDLQGFLGKHNKFILKEIAILSNETPFECKHFIIEKSFKFHKLPLDQQITNSWLYHNHHGIHWNTGTSKLEDVIKYMETNLSNKNIYLKGQQKICWLNELIGYMDNYWIHDFEDYDCPSLKILKNQYSTNTCFNHTGGAVCCALQNIHLYKKFHQTIDCTFI